MSMTFMSCRPRPPGTLRCVSGVPNLQRIEGTVRTNALAGRVSNRSAAGLMSTIVNASQRSARFVAQRLELAFFDIFDTRAKMRFGCVGRVRTSSVGIHLSIAPSLRQATENPAARS